MILFSTKKGTSAASQGPKPPAKEWAIPNLGVDLLQRGAKWISVHIFPSLYIFVVLLISDGIFI